MTEPRPELILIAALDANRLIGAGGGMPWRLPGDLKRFRARTMGHPILMGRTTFEGLGRALPGRRNLVLSRDPHFQAQGAEVFARLDQALAAAAEATQVMVIGGAQIYGLALPRAQRLILTLVRGQFEGDTWFPALPRTWRAGPPTLHPADEKNTFDCIDFEFTPGSDSSTSIPPELAGWFAPAATTDESKQST